MKTILIFLTFIVSQTCNKKISDIEVLQQLPTEIETVYFQKWIGGQEQSGSGTNFYIQFKNSFPQNITLQKLYFQGQETEFVAEDENTYTSNFKNKPKQDRIFDANSEKEFGNKPPEILNPKFNLKPNEAVLEFKKDNKTVVFILKKVKEKELLAYPAAKPRN